MGLTLRTATIGVVLALSVLVAIPQAGWPRVAAEESHAVAPITGPEEQFYSLALPRGLQLELDLEAENRMLDMVNESRSELGLPTLIVDPQLQAAARDHSRDMFLRAYFSHISPDRKTPFERIRAAGVVYVTAAENIAYAPDVAQAQKGLVASPLHLANITNLDFRRVGIGVYRAEGYEEMFTQDFADFG